MWNIELNFFNSIDLFTHKIFSLTIRRANASLVSLVNTLALIIDRTRIKPNEASYCKLPVAVIILSLQTGFDEFGTAL